jgi:tetratricopeptide (TPR) repeat protein
MARAFFAGVAWCLATVSTGWAQPPQPQPADSRTVLGGGNQYLSAGADAIRAGQYEDGIRLTTIGLGQAPTQRDRAAGLSNLCAAHAAKGEPDRAIDYCTQSIHVNETNWRAYSNRAYAHLLKGMVVEATADLAIAAQHSPDARQVLQIRGMINERSLQPSVTVEEHQ